MYGSRNHYYYILRNSNTVGNMGNSKMNWIINVILGILISLTILSLIQLVVNYWNMGWY